MNEPDLSIIRLESHVGDFRVLTETSAASVFSSFRTSSEVHKVYRKGANQEYKLVHSTAPYSTIEEIFAGHLRLIEDVQRNPRKYTRTKFLKG